MNDTFDAVLETLHLDSETLAHAPGATIVPRHATAESTPVLDELPTIAFESSTARRPEMEWLGLLGEGGMGRVALAKQIGLERNVAVKTPKSANDPRIVESILQEAYVTGLVEHPNVVPIYTLGRDHKGAPLIVMKRIEGDSWADVLARAGEHDLLWHIKVLVQVCNALRYAHRRGIVHRDIKPENVMIGEFGEVYLLDWGIALSVDEGASPLMPNRKRARGLAGTPAYMAPEMAEGNVAAISTRSDIYLLGATLYEVITGRPPHNGGNIADVLRLAYISAPPHFEGDTPEPLQAIVRRAMARNPEDRYPDVESFVGALENFLEHRGSMELTQAARLILERLERSLNEGQGPELTDLFAECRFGFQQALRQWPENQAAAQGLRDLSRSLIRFHLRQENIKAARATLDAMEMPDLESKAMVEAAEARRREQVHELELLTKLAERFDPRISQGVRSFMMVLMGVAFCGSAMWEWVSIDLANTHEARVEHLMSLSRASGIAFLSLIGFRRAMLINEVNKRFALIMLSCLTIMATLRLVVVLAEIPMTIGVWLEYPIYGLGVGMLGVIFKKRMALAGTPYLLVTVLGAMDPKNAMLYSGLCHLLVFCGVAWVWRPGAALQKELGGA